MHSQAALLIVDVQNDFCPGGSLQISSADRVIAPINKAIHRFTDAGLPVLASRDWHPPVTVHFKEYGGPWPVHCVQGTAGACFHPDLQLPEGAVILSKGTVAELPGYSAFEAVNNSGKTLEELLREQETTQLYVCGLATDYCVLHTTLDALQRRFLITLLTDAVAGVDSMPGASSGAIAEMVRAGASLTTVDELRL